jgi:hypothetical protein
MAIPACSVAELSLPWDAGNKVRPATGSFTLPVCVLALRVEPHFLPRKNKQAS